MAQLRLKPGVSPGQTFTLDDENAVNALVSAGIAERVDGTATGQTAGTAGAPATASTDAKQPAQDANAARTQPGAPRTPNAAQTGSPRP